jgi:hypothetical protein
VPQCWDTCAQACCPLMARCSRCSSSPCSVCCVLSSCSAVMQASCLSYDVYVRWMISYNVGRQAQNTWSVSAPCTGVVPPTPRVTVDDKNGDNGTLIAVKHGRNCKSAFECETRSDCTPTTASVIADVTRSHTRTLERHKFVIVIGFVISIYVFYLVVYVVMQYLRVCSVDDNYRFKYEFQFLYNSSTKILLFSTLSPRPSSLNVYFKHSSACIQSFNRSVIFVWLNFAKKCNGTPIYGTNFKCIQLQTRVLQWTTSWPAPVDHNSVHVLLRIMSHYHPVPHFFHRS